ncbi:uncharacterized protein LOC136085171 [Hydra vulgaris]|uniref:Uncharacterized protein LOC136085171 n=1 Tax=Hydra vulgaris TaxID=6087 RepID=A0ABM4CL77_HYDVU
MAIKKRKHKEDIKGLKDKLKKLQNQIFCLKQQLTSTQRKFSYQMAMLSQQLAEKNSAILILQNEIQNLQEELEEIKQVTQNTKNEKCYSADIRRLIYDMLVCQVPTQSVPSLLRKIGEHTGYRFSQIPHRTTVEQMMRELGVLSDLQAAEIAFTTKDLTLGFDATTQEGVHINAVHLTTESVCMVVAIDQLPGGTAYDYQSHITKSIDNLAKLYSDFYQLKYTDVRSTIIGNITNTMSDRVATNHATIAKLNLVWQKSLNELNCHLHPLDTMTSSCKSSLKALETSKGKLFGRDCIAANIVVQLNKLRYKDAKGDPKGFVTFLDQHELPRGLLPRYRGNRLHMLFHTCGILIHHYATSCCKASCKWRLWRLSPTSTTNVEDFSISSYVWLQFRKYHPCIVFFKTDFNGEFESVGLRRNTRKLLVMVNNIPPIRTTPKPIAVPKYRDPMTALQWVPSTMHLFYKSISTTNNNNDASIN